MFRDIYILRLFFFIDSISIYFLLGSPLLEIKIFFIQFRDQFLLIKWEGLIFMRFLKKSGCNKTC